MVCTNLVLLGVNFLHNWSKMSLKQAEHVEFSGGIQDFRIVDTAFSTAESKLESIFCWISVIFVSPSWVIF